MTAGSEDAAVLMSLADGLYTAKISGVDGAAGIALAEVYGVAEPLVEARLMNISTRGPVGKGASALIAGFVIEGTSAQGVLIRGVGPSLAGFDVTGFLENPRIILFRASAEGSVVINGNDDWEDAPNLAALNEVVGLVGAFEFEGGTADAALFTVLPPGNYTAVVRGVDDGEGAGLVEVYRLP